MAENGYRKLSETGCRKMSETVSETVSETCRKMSESVGNSLFESFGKYNKVFADSYVVTFGILYNRMCAFACVFICAILQWTLRHILSTLDDAYRSSTQKYGRFLEPFPCAHALSERW